jgi:hypothetical protein
MSLSFFVLLDFACLFRFFHFTWVAIRLKNEHVNKVNNCVIIIIIIIRMSGGGGGGISSSSSSSRRMVIVCKLSGAEINLLGMCVCVCVCVCVCM